MTGVSRFGQRKTGVSYSKQVTLSARTADVVVFFCPCLPSASAPVAVTQKHVRFFFPSFFSSCSPRSLVACPLPVCVDAVRVAGFRDLV